VSNVPSHSRTRHTHRKTFGAGDAGVSRRSHSADAFLPPIEGAEEVYQQVSIDEAGQVTAGQIAPGAVAAASFAAGIAPVLLVHGLPTLPNSAYPIDTFVYDIDASPKRLYKNVADVWTAAVGPDDIQANSITAGQIAAGAVSTSELAVGARLVGEVANDNTGTPGVFIDSSGILIRDGKLTLEDEFGLTTMQASGFSGSWADYVGTGLYNGTFAAGAIGGLPIGRTPSLPYWNITKSVGNPTVTRDADSSYPGGYRLRATFSAIGDAVTVASDPVPVVGGMTYGVAIVYGFGVTVAGTLDLFYTTKFYDAAGSLIATDGPNGWSKSTVGVLPAFGVRAAVLIPSPLNARTATVTITMRERVAHNAANYVEIGLVAFLPTPITLDTDGDYNADSMGLNSLFVGGVFVASDSLDPAVAVTGNQSISGDLTVGGKMPMMAMFNFVFIGGIPISTAQAMEPIDGSLTFSAAQSRYIMPWDGSIVGIFVRAKNGRTGGTLTAQPTITGGTGVPTAQLDSVNTSSDRATSTRGTRTFSAGASLGATLTSSSAWAPTAAGEYIATVFVVFDAI
jgi:hypothetical protein